jgi:hypothetical protein
LEVAVNGSLHYNQLVGANTVTRGWKDVSIDLSRWSGQRIKIELRNKANNWSREYGYWRNVRVSGSTVSDLNQIYKALRITDARVIGEDFKPGAEILISFKLTNTSDNYLIIPRNGKEPGLVSNGSWKHNTETFDRRYSVGIRQHWIERLGADSTITAIPRRTAKEGSRYAATGWTIKSHPSLAPGKGMEFKQHLSTVGFLPGEYRFYIEYKDLQGAVLQTVTVDFTLNE